MKSKFPFQVGDIVEAKVDIDRFPFFIVPKGSIGKVVSLGNEAGNTQFAVRWDRPILGAKHWNNEVWWDYASTSKSELLLYISSSKKKSRTKKTKRSR